MVTRFPKRAPRLALLLTLSFTAPVALAEDGPSEPIDLDLEERVEVQMVLIDAIVLNAKNETVDGLEAEDFDLLVDDKDVEIASLDLDCPLGALPDPPVSATRPTTVPAGFATPRRYVFVLDYYHMGADHSGFMIFPSSPMDVLHRLREAVERLHVPGEEYMLISLGQVLRIEVPFTDDLEEFRRGIDRVMRDRWLYAGFYGRLTERRWFDQILRLLDLMELIPGHKSVVLFSGPFLKDGWYYDETFWKIAAMSGQTRTAFYPVTPGGWSIRAGTRRPAAASWVHPCWGVWPWRPGGGPPRAATTWAAALPGPSAIKAAATPWVSTTRRPGWTASERCGCS